MTGKEDEESQDDAAGWLTWTRRIVAGLIVASAAALVVAGPAGGLQRCTKTVAVDVENRTSTERSCQPVSTTDVLLAVGVAGLLLLPDISELEVAGIVTLRRRVKQQEERQERLEQQMLNLSQTVVQKSSWAAQFNIGAIEQGQRRVEELAESFIEPPAPPALIERLASVSESPPENVPAREQLRRLAAQLTEMVAAADAIEDDASATSRQRSTLRRWRDVFRKEIEAVQDLAQRSDSVGATEDLTRGIALARQLLDLLRRGLELAEPQEGTAAGPRSPSGR